MRTSHILAAAILAATALASGQAAAFSMQDAGSGSAAGTSGSAGYADPDAKLMQGALGDIDSVPGSRFDQPGSSLDQSSKVFNGPSGFSMSLQQPGKADAAANRYFSTETNPWK